MASQDMRAESKPSGLHKIEIQTGSHCINPEFQWGKHSVGRVCLKIKDILQTRAGKMFAFLKLGAGSGEGSAGKQNLPPKCVSWHESNFIFKKQKS